MIGEITGRGRRGSRLLPVLATLLLLASVALLLWLGVRKERVVATPRPTILAEALLLLLVAMLGGKLCYLLATGLGNVIGTPPFDRAHVYTSPSRSPPWRWWRWRCTASAGACWRLLLAARRVILEDSGWALMLYAMASSLAAILTVDHYHFRQRSVMVRAGAVVGGVSVACVLMLAAIAGGEPHGGELTLQVVSAFAGGVLAAAVASFCIPGGACSRSHRISSSISPTPLPLLRRALLRGAAPSRTR